MSENKALLDGKYLMYKGKPLVREKKCNSVWRYEG